MKAWLVRREDHFRPAYARRAVDFLRQNVFAASTNKEDWLNDDTGGRRFWPVKTGVTREIDIAGLLRVVRYQKQRSRIPVEMADGTLSRPEFWTPPSTS